MIIKNLSRKISWISLMILFCLVISSCSSPATSLVETEEPQVEEISPTATRAQPQATSTPEMPSMEPAWTFATEGKIWSSPVMADGVIFFGSDDQNFYAVDAASHELKWKFTAGEKIRSTPLVLEEKVYFIADDGYLYALDTTGGIEFWRVQVDANPEKRNPIFREGDQWKASPVAGDGLVYIGSFEGILFALDAATGVEVWRFQNDSKWRIRSAPLILEGKLYFGDWMGDVYALDAASGAKIWKASIGGNILGTPVVNESNFILGSMSGLYAMKIEDGEIVWSIPSTDNADHIIFASTPVKDGVVFANEVGRFVCANDAETGEEIWHMSRWDLSVSTPALDEKNLYFGDLTGLTALDQQTGEIRWFFKVKNGVPISPLLSDGMLYFGGLDNNLYAIDVGS